MLQCSNGPWPNPTRAYFWPAVNKRLTWVFLDPTQWDYFGPMQKMGIFRGNFPNRLTWPWPGSKIFNLDSSLLDFCLFFSSPSKPSEIFFEKITNLKTFLGGIDTSKFGNDCFSFVEAFRLKSSSSQVTLD